ncbi:hypothetical protein ABT160_39530 [Streptomyces sp. NPDC001941]|uniref:hypothetical protein n=1 Tax=Streptomyces sp. NPDC001941 TaxID=3154659 RepID=UPI0033237FDA
MRAAGAGTGHVVKGDGVGTPYAFRAGTGPIHPAAAPVDDEPVVVTADQAHLSALATIDDLSGVVVPRESHLK